MFGLDLLLIVSGPQLILPVRLGDPGIRRLPLLLLSVAGESLPKQRIYLFLNFYHSFGTHTFFHFLSYIWIEIF